MADLELVRRLGLEAHAHLEKPLYVPGGNGAIIAQPIPNVEVQRRIEDAYQHYDPGANPMPSREDWWLDIRNRLKPRQRPLKSAINRYMYDLDRELPSLLSN